MPLGPDQQGQPQQYSDTSAVPNTNYLYKVTAVGANATGESDYSSPTSGFMPPIVVTKNMEVVLEGGADGYWLAKLKNKFGIQNSVGGYEGYTAYKEYGTNSSKCYYQTNITVPSGYMVPQRVSPGYHDGNYYSPPINQTTEYGLYGDTLFGLYHEVTIGGVPKLVWLKDFVYNEKMLLDDNTTEAYAVYTYESQFALYGVNFVIPDFIDIDYNIKNMFYDIDSKLDNRARNIGYNGASGENYPKYGWLNYEFWHKELSYFPAVYEDGATYGTGKTASIRASNTQYDYENYYLRIPSIPNGHAHHDPGNRTWGTNPTGKKYRIALASRFMNLGIFNGTPNVVGAGSNYSVESKIVWTSEYKRTDQYGSPYVSAKYAAGQLTDNDFTNWEIPVDYRSYANTIKLKHLCSQELVAAGIKPWLTPAHFTLWHSNRRQKIINLHLTILQKIKQRYPKILWSFYSMGGGEYTGGTTYSIIEYRNRQGPSITGKTVYDLWLEGGIEIWSTTLNNRDASGNLIPRDDADILSGVILGAGMPLDFAFSKNNQNSPKTKLLHPLAYGQILAAQDWLNTAAYFVDDPEDNILYSVYVANNRFHDNISGAKFCKYLMDRTTRGLNEANEWLDQTYGITKPTFFYVADCYEPNAYSSQPSTAQQNGRPGEKNRFYHGRIHPKTWKKWIFDYINSEVKRPGSYITGYAHWQASGSGHRAARPPQSPKLWKLKFESLYVENFPSGSDLISVNNTSSGEPQTYSGDGDYDYAKSAAWAGASIRDTDNAIIGIRRGDLLGYKRDPGDARLYFGNSPYGQNVFYYYGKYLYTLYNHCYTGEPLDYWIDLNPFEKSRYFFNPNSTIALTSNVTNPSNSDQVFNRTRLINTFNTYLKPRYWDNDIGVYINTSVPTNPGTTNNYIISNPSNYYWYDFRVILNDPSNYIIPTSIQDTIFNAKYPSGATKTLVNYPPIPQYNFARVPYKCSDRIIPWVQFFAPSVVRKDTVLLHDDRTNRSVFCHKYLKFKTYSSPFDWALVDQKDGSGEFLLPEFLDLDSLLAVNLRRNFIYLPYGRTIKTNTHSISGDDPDNRTLWMWGNISMINNLLVDRTTIPFDYLSTSQANEITTDDGRDPIYNISYINKSYPTGTVPVSGFFDAATGQLDTAFSQSTTINKKPFPKEPLDIKYLEKYIKQGMTTFADNVKSKYSSSLIKLKPEFIAYMGNVPFGDMFEGETRMKMPLAYHMDPRSAANKEIWIKMLNDATKHWVNNFRSPVDGMARMIIDSAAAYPTFYCEFANESMTTAPTYSLSGGVFADTTYDYRYFYRNTGHINNFLLWYIGSNMTFFADTGLQTFQNPYGGLLLDPEKSIHVNEVRNFKIGMELSQSSVFWTAITPAQHVGNSRRRTNQNMSETLYNYGFERCGTDSNPKRYTRAYTAGISDVEFCASYNDPCIIKGVANGSWSWNRNIISPIARNCTYQNSKYGLIPSNHWSQKLFNDSDYTPDLFVAPFDALETFPNVLRDKINNLNNIAIAKTSTGSATTTNNNIFEDLSVDKIYTNYPKNSSGVDNPYEQNWSNDTTLPSQPEGTLPRSILINSHLIENSMKCRDQYGRTGIEGTSNAPTFPNNKTAVKGSNNIHMTGEMMASASLQNPSLLEPKYYPMFHNTFTENDGTNVVWKKCAGSDIVMQKFLNWVSLNRTVRGGDFNALPIDHLKSDMRYILSYSENNTRKYWYADSYVNNSSNTLSGLSWSWMRDRRFTIFVLWPLLLKRGMSIITDLFGPTSYDPNQSLFMNINYDPNDPNEPLIKPPTKEELLYVFMSSGISNPEMLEGFFDLFHVSSDFSSPNVQGLWATTWNNSSLNSSLLVKSFTVTGRLMPNPAANKDETIASPSAAVTFFNANSIPESRRVILPNYLNASYGDFYWLTNGGYNSATCTAGQSCDPRISYDLATNTGDACKDSTGAVVFQTISNDPRILTNPNGFSGSLTFASPWLDTVNARIKTSWNNWLTSYNSAGGKVSYIVGDIVDSENLSNVNVFSEFLRKNPADGGDQILTHINTIVADPRTNSSTAGNAATYGTLRSQLKLDSGYTTADFNTRDLTGSKGGYKLWNFVTSRLAAFYLNDALYNTSKAIFPNIKLSNYDNTKIFESDKLSDLNGHKSYFNNDIGNYVAVALYGEWNAGNIYYIDSLDPTSLNYDPSTSTTKFGTTAWNAFAVSQQRLRAVDRNRVADSKQLQVWLGSINYYDGNSFGGNTTQHNNYWRENAYHALLRNPDPILYWNSNSASSPTLEKEMSDVIKEVNSITNMKIVSTISSSNDKINYNTTFIASGCRARGTDTFFVEDMHVWRITVDFNKVETVIIDGITYNLKTIYATNGIPAVGFWYKTNNTKIKIIQSNYNSSTKTLTLASSTV